MQSPVAVNSRHVRALLACAVAIVGIGFSGLATLHAQEQFQFVVSVLDEKGAPVTDLKPDDIVMKEAGKPAKVTKIEPLSLPVKVTMVLDNSSSTQFAMQYYHDGLTGFINALPPDVEMTIIATAPQPRTVVKPTTDHAQLIKGVTSFGPENASPRPTDAFVEFSQRLQKESKDKPLSYLPVLVLVSTPANETTSYEVDTINKALNALVQRHTKLFVVMASMNDKDVKAASVMNTTGVAQMTQGAVKVMGGRYESLPIANALATMLPEYGKQIGNLHQRHAHQFRVTVTRPAGMSGPLQEPSVEIARPGLKGEVSLDGYLP
jgi:hypothetical protein